MKFSKSNMFGEGSVRLNLGDGVDRHFKREDAEVAFAEFKGAMPQSLNVLGDLIGETREQLLERAIAFSFRIDDFYDKETFLKYVANNDVEIMDETNGWPEFMKGAMEPVEGAS